MNILTLHRIAVRSCGAPCAAPADANCNADDKRTNHKYTANGDQDEPRQLHAQQCARVLVWMWMGGEKSREIYLSGSSVISKFFLKLFFRNVYTLLAKIPENPERNLNSKFLKKRQRFHNVPIN